jgi:VWFA-related protein
MRLSSAVLIALLLGLSIPVAAGQAASPAQAPPLARRPTGVAPPGGHHISLDVVVSDRSGNPVPGLQQQDFTILDDKQPQTITSFSAFNGSQNGTDNPLQSIVVIDAVNTPFQGVAFQRTGLDTFLRHDGGELPLPTSITLLTDKSCNQSAPTQDGIALAKELDSQRANMRIITRSQGFYGAIERVQISLGALDRIISSEANQPGRKLLIWLGPGWPLLSGPHVQLSTKDRNELFQTVVRLSTALREAQIILYNVNPAGTSESLMSESYYEDFLKGVSLASRVQNGNLALQVLVVQSGGQVIYSSTDVADSITRCLADRKAFYTLTFDSPPADRSNEYHSLQVKIDKPRLTARTRTGYYAQP